MPFKVVTINILSDLSLWEERRPLLIKGLAEIQPLLIAVQEANIPNNTAFWLAGKLGMEHIHLSRKTGDEGEKEGIAILSRVPFEAVATLDLKTQNRVAQSVQVTVDGQKLVLANGHFYWQPGDSAARLAQIEQLIQWLSSSSPAGMPVIVCGDFNSTPESQSIRKMREHFASAYAVRHGRDPDFTAPTPLPRSKLRILRTLWNFRSDLRLRGALSYLRSTLDYVFVNERLRVLDSRLVLNEPAPGSRKLYASDHFGIEATLEIKL